MPKGKGISSTTDVIDNFWELVEKSENCWHWNGSKTEKGYGKYFAPSKHNVFASNFAHRFSYWLANGDFDTSLQVCHRCDNPSCVNPEHLFLGTRSDNMQDCADKGRLSTQNGSAASGENSGRAKLNWQQVREIRERFSNGGVSQRELGRQYGVDGRVINKIIHNKIWIERG